jgi:hypothetical protein
MSRKTYRVELTEADCTWLFEFIGRGSAPAREQTRARVLLKADQGPDGPAWPDDRIADALELSIGGTKGIRRRFAERGLKGCVKRKKPDREYERKLDGEQEARLVQLACSEAPDGRSQWSLRLLADRLVQLGIVDSISYETVRQTLQTDRSQTDSSRIAAANG